MGASFFAGGSRTGPSFTTFTGRGPHSSYTSLMDPMGMMHQGGYYGKMIKHPPASVGRAKQIETTKYKK